MIPSRRNNNLVLIEKKVKVPGEYNPVVTWVEHKQVWVSIDPNRGREIQRGAELQSIVTHTIRGDFLDLEDVDETMRVVHSVTHTYDPVDEDAKVYGIVAALVDEDHHRDVMLKAELNPRRYSKIPPNTPI